jgi:hypothetical protein
MVWLLPVSRTPLNACRDTESRGRALNLADFTETWPRPSFGKSRAAWLAPDRAKPVNADARKSPK